MTRLLVCAILISLLAGCDSAGTSTAPDTLEGTSITPLHGDGPESRGPAENYLHAGRHPFGEPCSPAQGGPLAFDGSNGFQFIARTQHGEPSQTHDESYAIGLDGLVGNSIVLDLYKVLSADPLSEQEDPVLAQFIESIELTPGSHFLIDQISQVLMWPSGVSHAGQQGSSEIALVTHPAGAAAAQNPDRPTDTDQSVPQWICEDPDLLGSIDITAIF